LESRPLRPTHQRTEYAAELGKKKDNLKTWFGLKGFAGHCLQAACSRPVKKEQETQTRVSYLVVVKTGI